MASGTGGPAWFPDWANETCVIVASGPSAASVPIDRGIGRVRFIAVNTSWRLCPWADMLYAVDGEWWTKAKGCPEFKGLKVTGDPKAASTWPGLKLVKVKRGDDRLVTGPKGTVGWGGNSGFQAINIAVQAGATKIILVGVDCTVAHGSHWHSDHPKGMNNPTRGNVARWGRAIDGAAGVIAAAGVRMINCGMTSSLKAYPKMGFDEALAV